MAYSKYNTVEKLTEVLKGAGIRLHIVPGTDRNQRVAEMAAHMAWMILRGYTVQKKGDHWVASVSVVEATYFLKQGSPVQVQPGRYDAPEADLSAVTFLFAGASSAGTDIYMSAPTAAAMLATFVVITR